MCRLAVQRRRVPHTYGTNRRWRVAVRTSTSRVWWSESWSGERIANAEGQVPTVFVSAFPTHYLRKTVLLNSRLPTHPLAAFLRLTKRVRGQIGSAILWHSALFRTLLGQSFFLPENFPGAQARNGVVRGLRRSYLVSSPRHHRTAIPGGHQCGAAAGHSRTSRKTSTIMETMMASMNARMPHPAPPFNCPIWRRFAASFPILGVILYFLITRRGAFRSE